MRAILQAEYGAPRDVLGLSNAAVPEIGASDVLVRTHAAGVHIGDWLTVSGQPYLIRLMGYGLMRPKNTVPGVEFAGRVEAVGEDVADFAPGDEVFGWGPGAFAEFVAVSHESLVIKPANVSFAEAAAVPISGFTALQAVRDHANVQPGDKVLVIGASGGVGTYAVQIARSYGAEVTGVASTRNIDMVRSIGAQHVIDYTTEEFARNGHRYDAIIDTAGNAPLSDLRNSLTPNGTLVIVGGSGGRFFMGAGRSLRAGLMSPFVSQNLRAFISKTTQEDLIALRTLIEDDQVKPVLERTYPLDEAAEAVAHVGTRHTQGKTVIVVDASRDS
ncbi:MAG: zinc-binding dehydrogenase [Proteobacteria bacterium]|nr:zinc-binding dehydrogenase [Pseudomonadota bacterium]